MIDLRRARTMALLMGLGGMALLAVGGFFNPREFFRSYLLGFVFAVSFAAGSLGIMLLHNLVGGRWGVCIGSFLDAGVRTLPWMALAAVPLLFGLPLLYPWAVDATTDPVLQHKAAYLNQPFFILRTFLYFALWIGIGFLLRRRVAGGFERGRPVSAPGLILFAFAVTFSAVDWIMSLEPHWFSTIYGAIFLVGQTLQTLAFCTALLALLAERPPFAGILEPSHFHDLGNLLLAFTVLWAYTAFSQFLIIWSGNIPEETTWYIARTHGGWQIVSVLLMVFHFGVPFAILLSRRVKRQAAAIGRVAVFLIVMRLVDLFYWTEPAYHHNQFALPWMRIAAVIAFTGLWFAAFLWSLGRRPLLDTTDPRLRLETAHAALT